MTRRTQPPSRAEVAAPGGNRWVSPTHKARRSTAQRAAPLFGAPLDGGRPGAVFFGAALVLAFAPSLTLVPGAQAGAASRVHAP